MTTFTPVEIEDARLDPRVGDVWEGTRWTRIVGRIGDERIEYKAVFETENTINTRYSFATIGAFCRWTRNATLVKRGDA